MQLSEQEKKQIIAVERLVQVVYDNRALTEKSWHVIALQEMGEDEFQQGN